MPVAPSRREGQRQMQEAGRAVAAAMSSASELDLVVNDAVVLNDSNRLVVRLLPCDIVARVSSGPVEYDLAWVPRTVSERYPDADQDLIAEYRGVVLALIAAHRWRRDDQHPSGRQGGAAFLDAVRQGPPWPPLDDVTW